MGIFSGMKDAKKQVGGVYFKKGVYVVEVKAVKTGKTRKGVIFFVVECKILESDNPERTPGMSVSWMVTADKDAFLSNVRGFVAEATDVDFETVDEVDAEAVCATDNPLEGLIISAEAVDVPTKAGSNYTRVTWERIPEEMQEEYRQAAAA